MLLRLSKFAAAVATAVLCIGAPPAAAQQAQDFGFGAGGLATAGVPAANERWNDIRLQPDGKIVVAGASGAQLLGSGGTLFVARYLPSGVLDTSFNRTGTASLALAAAKHIAIQPDGKILVAGDNAVASLTPFDGVVISQTPALPADIHIARFNADGTLDTSFGVNGQVRTDFAGGIDTAERLVLFPSGKFWVIGATSSPRGASVTNWAIVGYRADGTLDTAFGTGGRVQVDFGQARLSASALDAAVVGDKVVIAGTSGAAFVVARVDATGQLDQAFGSGGVTQLVDRSGLPSPTLRATALVALADGRLFASGNFTYFDGDAGDVSTPLAYATRLTAEGQLDPGFNAFPTFSMSVSANAGAAIAGGRVFLSVSGSSLIRLNEDGSRDAGFGSGGFFRLQTNNAALSLYLADSLVAQPDGGIAAAGAALQFIGGNLVYQSDAAIVRIGANGVPTTPPPPPSPSTRPPAAPSNLSASVVTAQSVTLTWRDNATNETSFSVERSANANFSNPVLLATLPANSTGFVDPNVVARSTYHYRVTARNAQGAGVSPTLAVTTPRR